MTSNKKGSSKKSRKKGFVTGILVAVLVAAIVSLGSIASFMINWQWFAEVGYTEVFFKKLFTQAQFFVPSFLISFLAFFLFMKSISAHMDIHKKIVRDRGYKKKRNRIFLTISLVLSFFMAISFIGDVWYSFLTFMNSSSFGIKDPIFARDIGFYIFTVPFINDLLGYLFGFIVLMFIFTLAYNVFEIASTTASTLGRTQEHQTIDENGNIIFPSFKPNIDIDFKELIGVAARQLSILIGIFFLILGANYFMRSFELLYSSRGVGFGANFVDVNVTLPSVYLSVGISILSAVLFIFGGKKLKFKFLVAGPMLLLIASIGGGAVAGAVQSLVVNPNEISKEEKYLQNNINYTNYAYGTDKVDIKSFKLDNNLVRKDLTNNKTTINNIPINDYRPARVIYNQIQGLKNYYNFSDIDIDRYMINGQYRQTFISARELVESNIPGTGSGASAWINKYLKYTHGYGVAMSPINEVTASGQPKLFLKDMPIESNIDIKVDVPQIYYGEKTNDFVIVGTDEKEFDYPSRDGNVETKFNAKSGIKLGLLNRLFFALETGKFNFILSSDINADSKILINREIVGRAKKIAPFLSYDSDPYMVTVKGKLYWIIDAYTVSTRYPYSEPISKTSSVNYVRNSVKVTIDAYTGEINYYMTDGSDPVVKTYSKIFKTLFKPLEQMPSELRAHLRYPQLMFDIQTSVFKKYHVKNARDLYNKSDLWDVATQISVNYGESIDDSADVARASDDMGNELTSPDMSSSNKNGEPVESAYTIIKLPGSDKEEFLLMVPYTPQGKNNMIAWLGVKCDGADYGKIILYKFPSGKVVEGPMQIEGIISQDTTISPQLNLLATGGNSQVIRGSMMTIPVDNSLLYVEPIYVKAVNANSLPELKKVIVYFNNQVVMEDNLIKALDKIFPGDKSIDQSGSTDDGTGTSKPGTSTETGNSQKQLVEKANILFKEAEEAQKAGDWATYGRKLAELKNVLSNLAK